MHAVHRTWSQVVERRARSRLPSLLKSATASEAGYVAQSRMVGGGAEAASAVAEQHADVWP